MALVNQIPNVSLEEKVALLNADRDLYAVRRAGRDGYPLKAAADRLYHALRDYVRRTDDERRKAVFTEIDLLRLHSRIEVRE
jgi:hypothetical protein